MVSSKDGGRTVGSPSVENFNLLAYGQTYGEARERLAFLVTTESGAMLYDLLSYIRQRVDAASNIVDPVYAKVLIAVGQVHQPDIPYLIDKPRQLDRLTGMLASLNTDIVCARTSTSPIALRALETGFPMEMGAIAALIDEAVGGRRSPAMSFRGRAARNPMQPR